jgi:hypothetical protein
VSDKKKAREEKEKEKREEKYNKIVQIVLF